MTAPNRTTKAQAQAYRFGVRRLEYAVSTGESFRRTIGGPRHGLSFIIGFVLAGLALAGFAVYSLISPSPSIGDAKVVIDSDNGGAYVVRDGRLHPALNYASALLAAGNDTNDSGSGDAGSGQPKTTTVDASTVDSMAKAQTLGIVGAPNIVPGEDDLVGGTWTVCDQSRVNPAEAPSSPPKLTTSVILGGPVVPASAVGDAATLVTPDSGRTTYLIAFGHRSKVDLTDRAVDLALHTQGTAPRPISSGLLAAIPAGADISEPHISGVGQPVTWSDTITVGTVFAVQFAAGREFYVALSDGAEQISEVVADLIRASFGTTAAIPLVRPSTLRQAPRSTAIDLSPYPSVRPRFRSVSQAPFICLDWTGGRGANAYRVYPTTSLGLPQNADVVPAPPNASAGSADAVYVPPGKGAVVGQVVGNQKASAGALFLVTDNGLRYPVVSAQAMGYLGLGKHVEPAPPSLLNLLPLGPTLDPASAAQYYGQNSGG